MARPVQWRSKRTIATMSRCPLHPVLHISIVTCERVQNGRFVVDTVRCTQTTPQHTQPQKDCDTVSKGLRSVRYTMSTHQPLHCQVALTNKPELLMAQRLLS